MTTTPDDSLHGPEPTSTGLLLPVAVTGTLMGLLVIAVMLLVMSKVHRQAESVPRLVDGKTPEQVLGQLRSESAQRLGSYGWVDKAKGVVHIPLEAAMEAFLLEQSRFPPPAESKK